MNKNEQAVSAIKYISAKIESEMEKNIDTAQKQKDDIIEALGGLPAPRTPVKKKPLWPIALFTTMILTTTAIILVLVVSNDTGSNSITTPTTQQETTEAYRGIVDSVAEIVGFTKTIGDAETGTALKQFISPTSALYKTPLDNETIYDYTGPDILWSTCEVIQAESYRSTIYKTASKPEVTAIFVPVQCQTTQGSIRELEFDMRKDASTPSKIFDIIVRVL